MLQPRAHPGQIEGEVSRYQTRTWKRKSRSVSAPTGQMSTTLPEYLFSSVLPGEEPDLRVVAPVEDAQLARSRDLVAEAHAARAQDAALGVEDDVGSQRHRLRLVDLLVDHPGIVEAVLHVVDLEVALPRLVAHRTVQRVVDQVELHDRLPRLEDPVRLREHHHALGGQGVAGDGGPGRLLDVHHAQPALPGHGEPGVIAVVRDLDAGLPGRLDEVGAGRRPRSPCRRW